ncbi:MAG: hypothetical protein HW380_1806 [Magnetococcales bacterium]|nr:hypothetical protein [Magnetococcales bacterium]
MGHGVKAVVVLTVGLLVGCAMGVNRTYIHQDLKDKDPIIVAVLPFENLSNSPTAGISVAQLFNTELLASGHFCLLEESSMRRQLIGLKVDVDRLADVSIARDVGRGLFVDAVLTGSVSEFSYQHGLREEPAVGFNIQLVRINDGVVLWRASQSLMGSGFLSRESIYYTAQKAVHNAVVWLSGDGNRNEASELKAPPPPGKWVGVGMPEKTGQRDQGEDSGDPRIQENDLLPGKKMIQACADLFIQRSLAMKKAEDEAKARENAEKAAAEKKDKKQDPKTVADDLLELNLPPK